MLARLYSVSVKNVLSFKSAKFNNIGKFGVIIGANNAGKSNFFKILKFLDTPSRLTNFANGVDSIEKNFFFNGKKPEDAELSFDFKIEKINLITIFKNIFKNHNIPGIPDEILDIKVFHTTKHISPENYPLEESISLLDKFQFLKMRIKFFQKQGNIYPYLHSLYFEIDREIPCVFYKINEFQTPIKYDQKKISWNQVARQSKYCVKEGNIILSSEIFRMGSSQTSSGLNFLKNNEETPEDKKFLNFTFFIRNIIQNFFVLMKKIPEFRNFEYQQGLNSSSEIKETGSNLPKYLFDCANNNKTNLKILEEMLQQFYPEITELDQNFIDDPNNQNSFNPQLNQLNANKVTVPYVIDSLNEKLTFQKLGKGIHQILIILANMIETRNEGILMIEEPELYIHPQLQKILFSILKKELPRIQVLITTHSCYFLDILDSTHSIHHLKRLEGRTSVYSEMKNHLDILLKDLGINPSDYLMNNGLILVEGKDDLEFFRNFIPEILNEYKIELRPINGKGNLHFWANSKLIEYFTDKNFKFLIILDNDEGNQKIKSQLEKIVQDFIILLPVREIENLYINPEILQQMVYQSSNQTELEDIAISIKSIIKQSVNEDLKWEKEVKFFFEDFPNLFNQKEKKKISGSYKVESGEYNSDNQISAFLNSVENLLEEKYKLRFNKSYYLSKFDGYKKKIEGIIADGEEWRFFSGKALKHNIISQLKQKFGFIFDEREFYRLIKKKGFIKKNLLDVIQKKLDI